MAPSQRVELGDLPPDILQQPSSPVEKPAAAEVPVVGGAGAPEEPLEEQQQVLALDWRTLLQKDAEARLRNGDVAVLDALLPEFERVLLQAALDASRGHKQLAAERLGWGRNTIARKMRSLGME